MAKKDLRPYVKIAVDMPSNHKIKGATAQAKWLAVVGVCWSVQNLTNGKIDPAVITALARVPAKYATDLVARGMWHKRGHHCPDCQQPDLAGELIIHHFEQHQDSAEKVRENRHKKAEAGREANHIRWKHAGNFKDCEACQK